MQIREQLSSAGLLRKFQGWFLAAVVIVTFGVQSCEVETIVNEITVVEEPVQGYFQRFIDEAANRGVDVEYATWQVSARIGDIEEPNVIGTCSYTGNHDHNIVLDEQYWKVASDLQREFLVFHELGHCVLGLDHNDDTLANGQCESIMSSGTGSCRVVYTNANRDRMLNELFSN